ncbi:hypothetical protein Clacol_008776 [Clathrus columnatus]|uniref:Uncharacterized protein n=1 Tax=Clathrus columnatus TaxID=1419009 RepID=A0AAV5AL76_9AGAM|nr:hypothetical protein Clacol_008776 [Clathrus columnatus]
MRSQPSSSSLSDALDFSNIKTSSGINERFSELAESLLLHHNLCIEYIDNYDHDDARSSTEIFEFQLLEIEFYLYSPNVHEDPFCHGHVNQTKAGQWYFHRAGKGKPGVQKSESETSTSTGGYRGGTRKGVDLTFGNPVVTSPFFPVSSSPIYGGILLRSMRSLDDSKKDNVVISGPSLLVDRILQLTRSESIAQLVNHKLKGHLSAFNNSPAAGLLPASSSSNEKTVNLYFRECTSLHHRSPRTVITTIERSPRVGLELSHSSVSPIAADPRVSFIGKMYRYFIHPNLLKSSHRYYNLIYHLSRRDFINHLEEQGEPLAKDLMARFEKEKGTSTIISNRVILEKYSTAFNDGYRKHDLRNFVGSSGKGVSSNPLKYLKMMGVLCRLGLLEENS